MSLILGPLRNSDPGSGTSLPEVINATVTLGAVAVQADIYTTFPDAINTTVVFPPATIQSSSQVSPATIAAPLTIPAVTVVTVEIVDSGPVEIDISITIEAVAELFGYTAYGPDMSPPGFKVVLLEPDGTPLCSLDNAQVGDPDWPLNGVGSFEFAIPIDDPKLVGNLSIPDTEVQLWRGADLLWSGVAVRAQGDDNVLNVQCQELGWYFAHRVVGTAEQNYIPNNSFEFDFEGWGCPTFDPIEPASLRHTDNWVQSISTFSLFGSKSLYQWANATIGSGVLAMSQFSFEATQEDGDQWYVVAWCYIPSNEWVAPRVRLYNDAGQKGALGIIFQRASSTETSTVFTPGIGNQTFPRMIEGINIPIDESTPKDRWVRLEAPLKQPFTGQPEFISIQLATPVGGIYWDQVSLVRRERLAFNDVDQATILSTLVTHAQRVDIGKSDLRITPVCPPTGVPRTRTYEYFNHELISDCIDEWPALWNGMDWSIESTATTRMFRSYHPMKGTRKPQYALILGKNVTSLRFKVDGEETANGITVMADSGEGAAREEALAYDGSTLRGGLVLEKVYVATPGSSVNTLQDQADRGLRRFRYPVQYPDLIIDGEHAPQLLGVLLPGDIVPVDVQYGWYNMVGDFRVTGLQLITRTGELVVSLNPDFVWEF